MPTVTARFQPDAVPSASAHAFHVTRADIALPRLTASAHVTCRAESSAMADAPDLAPTGYVMVGGKGDPVRFLVEYDLAEINVRGLISARMPPGAGATPERAEYFVHASLLRPHGEFPCAGDCEALSFCRQIADEMAALFDIAPEEAVARINQHWSRAGSDGTSRGSGSLAWTSPTTRRPATGRDAFITGPTRDGGLPAPNPRRCRHRDICRRPTCSSRRAIRPRAAKLDGRARRLARLGTLLLAVVVAGTEWRLPFISAC
jgi:hypothetical protein